MNANIALISLTQFAIVFARSAASSRSAFVGISASSYCNKIHHLMHHQSICHQHTVPRRRTSNQSIQQSSTTSLYVKSLRDIIDNDGPPPSKSNSFNTLNNLQPQINTANSINTSTGRPNIPSNTNSYKQQLQEAKEAKLTNQIKNKSTQEIKKELEHTHSISTTAIRGKENLVKRLVDARLSSMKANENDNDSVKNDLKVSCAICVYCVFAECARDIQRHEFVFAVHYLVLIS